MTIEERVQRIEDRNARVEAEKAWEVSMFRVATIVGITYIVATGVLFSIGNDAPFRNALIPAIGYFLSTQSLPAIKRSWIKKNSGR